MTYLEHLIANWKVAFKGISLGLFHFIHGLIPCKYTDHEYWGINFRKQ